MNKKSSLSGVMLGIASLTLSASVFAGTTDDLTESWNDFWGVTTSATKTTANKTMDTAHRTVNMHKDMDMMKMSGMNEAEYMVVDKDDHRVKFLDGLDKGHHVSDKWDRHHYDCMKGDKITDLRTNRSGIIKGVKDQGTMDVTTADGKTVRYQYVTFKIKPVK